LSLSIQLVLNTAARLIAHFSWYSRISTYMFDELHWLPLRARIQFKIFTLIFKAQWGLAPKYLVDVILRPHSASSNRPLRSLNQRFPNISGSGPTWEYLGHLVTH